MKKIKFRGIDVESKKYVYGFFLNCADASVIADNEGLKTVYPGSVVPFVGYDADGNEVYEGDKFTDKFGHTYTARLLPQAICKNGNIRFDWMPKSCDFHILSDDFDVEEGYYNENY